MIAIPSEFEDRKGTVESQQGANEKKEGRRVMNEPFGDE